MTNPCARCGRPTPETLHRKPRMYCSASCRNIASRERVKARQRNELQSLFALAQNGEVPLSEFADALNRFLERD